MFNDAQKYYGSLKIEKNGTLILEINNLIVTVGKGLAASRLGQNTPGPITHMAIGTDTTPPAVGQTALLSELAGGRVASVFSVAGAVAKWEATFPAGAGTGNVTEAGMFNASTAGVMMSRVVFAAIPKTSTDELKITWTIEAQ